MTLIIRRNQFTKMQRTMAYISFLILLSITSHTCFAFQGARTCGSLQLQGKRGLLFPGKQFRPNTSLFGSDDDDEGDDEKRSTNNLDIFGQSKDDRKINKLFDDEGDIRGPDRYKSCIPYILPLIDGDSFGKYIYERIPPLGDVHYVLLRPIAEGVQHVPILSTLLFIIFALGPRLTNQSREVRFNAQQAILIDVALIFPELLGDAVADADAKFPRAIMEPSSNFVWYFYVSLVIYCVTSNLRGRKPDQIPFISNLTEYAIGPF